MLKKAEQLLFYFLIFSIPFQTRILLRQFNTVGVGFNEWLSAFVYGTDILIAALFFLWVLRLFDGFKATELGKSDYAIFLFFAVSAVSILFSFNKIIGLYNLVKLAEFLILYFYLRSNIGHIFSIEKIFKVIVFSGLFQAVLAIAQFVKQSDLGFKYLGEAVLNPGIFGAAVLYVKGESFIRSYGTTPHPNVLAMFLLVAVFSLYFLILNEKKIWASKKMLLYHALLVFGLLFTFSRTVISTWILASALLVVLVFFKKKFLFFSFKKIIKLASIFILTVIIFGIFLFLFYPQFASRITINKDDPSFNLRIWYAKEGLARVYQNPVTGVGIGNFVSDLAVNKNVPKWLEQPVHNIYLLISAETGILGIIAFVLFIFFLIREYALVVKFKEPKHYFFLIFFLSVLFVGIFDHFLWTLQQGRLIFWLIAALLASVLLREKRKRIKIVNYD